MSNNNSSSKKKSKNNVEGKSPTPWKRNGILSVKKAENEKKIIAPIWVRLGVSVISSEQGDTLFNAFVSAVDSGAKRGDDFIVGYNSVSRAIEKSTCEVVCILKEKGSMKILDLIVESAITKRIPLVLVQNLSNELCSVLKLKSLSCFCLRRKKSEEISKPPKCNDENNDDINTEKQILLSAKMDSLREIMLSLSFCRQTFL